MPFVKLNCHLVWAFKNRASDLTPELEASLFPYLVAQGHQLGCRILAVNGFEAHIHIVLTIPPTLSVSAVVKSLKGASAHALAIHWQVGYGAFTVGEKGLPVAVAYVNNQKRHHAQKTVYPALERWEDEPSSRIREERGEYRLQNGEVGDDGDDLQ